MEALSEYLKPGEKTQNSDNLKALLQQNNNPNDTAKVHEIYHDEFNAVDLANKTFFSVTAKPMPSIWTTRLAFHFLRVGIVNSWVLYQLMTKSHMTLAKFRKVVALQWLNEQCNFKEISDDEPEQDEPQEDINDNNEDSSVSE